MIGFRESFEGSEGCKEGNSDYKSLQSSPQRTLLPPQDSPSCSVFNNFLCLLICNQWPQVPSSCCPQSKQDGPVCHFEAPFDNRVCHEEDWGYILFCNDLTFKTTTLWFSSSTPRQTRDKSRMLFLECTKLKPREWTHLSGKTDTEMRLFLLS
jgi:hypothetical protein